MGHVKVAITLPEELFRRLEGLRKRTGQSRSRLIRHAIEESFRQDKISSEVKRYLMGYVDLPETKEEIEEAEQSATDLLAGEPW